MPANQSIAGSLFLSCVLLCLFAAISLAEGADREHAPPNIVVIMADDLGYGDPGCYNARSKIKTPHIDRLAEQGMRFTDAHSPSAVCTPTRYGLLTGRYCWRTSLESGVLWGYSPCMIEPGRLTVADLLKQHGYATACVGKWHLGLGADEKADYSRPLKPGPNDLGFDYFFGIPASLDMEPYVFVENDRAVEAPTETITASDYVRNGGKGFWRAGPIAPSFRHADVLPKCTDQALAFIRRQAETSPRRPFFLYFPLSAPHSPWVPTDEFRGQSDAGVYGDFVQQVDDTLGRIVQALDETGQADDTLLIFTSDNGAHWLPSDIEQFGHLANGPLRGQKADAHEGGHRVPFIARWSGKIKPSAVSDQLICHTDLLATVAALMGAELPREAGEDSFSYLPTLLSRERDASADGPPRESIVHHSGSGYFAVRRGPWKLILGRGSGGFSEPRSIPPKQGEPAGQLYNLADDPAEAHDCYDRNPEVVKQLSALLEELRSSGRSRP